MPYNEAQKKATAKYRAKAYRRVSLDMKLEEYEEMKAYTEKTGESVNGFIRRLIKQEINK